MILGLLVLSSVVLAVPQLADEEERGGGVSEESCTTLSGSNCLFPFTFQGEEHLACTVSRSGNSSELEFTKSAHFAKIRQKLED